MQCRVDVVDACCFCAVPDKFLPFLSSPLLQSVELSPAATTQAVMANGRALEVLYVGGRGSLSLSLPPGGTAAPAVVVSDLAAQTARCATYSQRPSSVSSSFSVLPLFLPVLF